MRKYQKTLISHDKFHIAKFSKDTNSPYLLFIHGGPGLNSGTLDYLIEHDGLFDTLNYNIILYDQRSCGRSPLLLEPVAHQDNINDLFEIYNFLEKNHRIVIKSFVGHSYGAKLLYDFYKKFELNIPGIFVSTANSILVPRVNNLLLDLSYLKKEDKNKYTEVLTNMDQLNLEKLWEITEKLTPLFQKNKDRPYLYWANLECYDKVVSIQSKINLPMNKQVFVGVRKELYSDIKKFAVDIKNLPIKTLWINGFHDYVMNGQMGLMNDSGFVSFYKSAHFPHIEENKRFCEVVNEFFEET